MTSSISHTSSPYESGASSYHRLCIIGHAAHTNNYGVKNYNNNVLRRTINNLLQEPALRPVIKASLAAVAVFATLGIVTRAGIGPFRIWPTNVRVNSPLTLENFRPVRGICG
jgi:hypothetical protein